MEDEDNNGKDQFLGIVRNEKFQPLTSESGGEALRLTTIFRQEGRGPEAGEIDLTQNEGRAIFVEGFLNGEWIFEAEVTDTAGPILSAVVEKIYGAEK